MRLLPACALSLLLGVLPVQAAGPVASALPAVPLVETLRDARHLNFDLIFSNDSGPALELIGLEATLFDREGRFWSQRRLDRNGDATTMSLATLPNRALPAKGRLVVFNPFSDFPRDAWLGDMRYVATFRAAGEADAPEQRVELRIAPRDFAPKTVLRLPLDGAVFVHDGHDLIAHHRRLDITGGMTTHFGITSNFMRYAHDFTIADDRGRLYRTDGATPEDWYGFGVPVHATGDGVVVETHDGMRDNRKDGPPPFTEAEIMANLKLFLGNHVVVDHGNGEYSLFAHLKQGSVRVKPGQRVAAGDTLGAMGMSGDAFLVHLHYQLQSGPAFEEGLPAYFRSVRAKTGDGWSPVYTGPVDSGDVVETAD
jgi:murein DD-endopeptidase MepM/ murein hydrolase activator NlpD